MACNEEAESETWITFFWVVENYRYFNDSFDCLFSPNFRVSSILWTIALHPRWDMDKNVIRFKVHRTFDSDSLDSVAKYDFAILAEDGLVLQISEIDTMYPEDKCHDDSPKEMPITKRAAELSRDTLRLRCRVRRTDGKEMKPATFFARTVLSMKKRNFLWDIKRFSLLIPGCKCTYTVMSPVENKELTLKIEVNKDDKIRIFIESCEEKIFYLKFQSFITDVNGSKVDCGKGEFTSDHKSAVCTLPFTKKCLMQNQHLYLKKDVLSLYCECSWYDKSPLKKIERIDFGISSHCIGDDVCATSYSPPTKLSQFDKMLDLKEDMQCLYDEGVFSDVKIHANTQTFHAHKAILSARSPVFRAMLTNDMKEKVQASVDVLDLEDDTVRRMLLYVYTNALEDLQWESALKLFIAADKYQIISLKSKCRSFLECNLCPKNLCEGLVLSDMHGDSVLKESAQNYILSHEKDVFGSDEWKLFTKNNCALAAETMLLIWQKKN
ncbi:TD and POZ domain-containing protein 3 [Trichonephila inaurata madagascariensis]|uniref:TD and POZ domain-containing protein 3 n=1 Tax=Trichonephila inaurata madagascariensis TaxID=2747483 RepID=A0A8X6MFZ9_9ARAC|nr:TD and POZ domain-containing protein 3 [Trichonephila inaurata madagascariensis]